MTATSMFFPSLSTASCKARMARIASQFPDQRVVDDVEANQVLAARLTHVHRLEVLRRGGVVRAGAVLIVLGEGVGGGDNNGGMELGDINDASENEILQVINELELNNSKPGGTHVTSAQNETGVNLHEDEANPNQEDEINPIQGIGVNLNQDEVSMEYKKEKEKRVGRRSSRRLAEQARQEMLKERKAAHGGHEVGDTSTDPLVLTSEDEEMETPPPAMERVPENQQNDADYVLFLLK
nr:uncharacterized protein LOC109166971 [Ipomoea trifida]